MKNNLMATIVAISILLCLGCGGFRFTKVASSGTGLSETSAPQSGLPSAIPVSPGTTVPLPVAGGGDFPPSPPLEALPPGQGTFVILDELASLSKGNEQNQAFCKQSRNKYTNDPVRRAFCGSSFPNIRSLQELMTSLGLSTEIGGGTKLAISTHSTSINPRTTSPINPRYFLFQDLSPGDSGGSRVLLTYSRGEPYIEIAGYDLVGNIGQTRVNFYLLRFEKECEKTNSCSAAHFLTSEFESNWSGITIYEDNDLVNTPLNCLGCHTNPTAGVFYEKGSKALLFREELRNSYWSHWIDSSAERNSAREMLTQFLGKDADQSLVKNSTFAKSDPEALWNHSYFTFQRQDNTATEFRAQHRSPLGSPSAAWRNLFQLFENGLAPPVPHHADDVVDSERIAAATQVMSKFLNGTIRQNQLPDFRDVYPESEKVNLGHRINPLLPPDKMLIAACGHCHSDDSTRAFKVSRISSLEPAMKSELLRRIELPNSDVKKMPPLRFRELSPAQIGAVREYMR